MPLFRRFGSLLSAGAAATLLVTGAVQPATASPDTAPPAAGQPDRTALLADYYNYWSPKHYDDSSKESKDATAWRGNVTGRGARVLKQNDTTLQGINRAGHANTAQDHRALVDADYDWKQTLPDSLGPVLGSYFSEGVRDGKLPRTTAALDEVGKASSTSPAKADFNYPRPFLKDRSFGGQNNLRGLAPSLNIVRSDDWTDPATGITHEGGYQDLQDGHSQAFPSGHTAYAYETGIELSMLVPQLGSEILTRSSEAGNNRIVLGVHYPMDVMGGRIVGHANSSARLADANYVKKTLKPAQRELRSYLTQECREHGQGRTLQACITNTGANADHGYKNSFTDAVSTRPVTDRGSALAAYRARMTYGFGPVAGTQQAAKVPAHAEDLLSTAFPQLTDAQRRQVLASTEIRSGSVLDGSSQGWQRINLPAAMSARVTLDGAGRVVSVKPGQVKASVVHQSGGSSSTGE